jgi:hypothetical protein
VRSNRNLTTAKINASFDEGQEKYMRAMRTEGFRGYKDLKLVDIPNSRRRYATRAHHSVRGIPTSESTAGLGRRGSRRGGGGRGNGLFCRFTCDVYRTVWRFREWNLQ